MTEKFISPAEFSRISGLSPATVSRYLKTGKISSIISPLGKRVIPVSELDRVAPGATEKSAGKETKLSFISEKPTNLREVELLREQIEILKEGIDRANDQIEFLKKQNSDLLFQLSLASEARAKLEESLLALPAARSQKQNQKRDDRGRFVREK